MAGSKHLVLIGDVGSLATYHVGDEAMLQANVDWLRRFIPNLTLTVVSADPECTSKQYGLQSIRRIGFAPAGEDTHRQREHLLAALLRRAAAVLHGGETLAADAALEVTEALARADGLVISGGGNLCSTWPEHIYERVAMIRIAEFFRKPTVVLGQTLGPSVNVFERGMLSGALPLARLVSVRDRPSVALGLSLGVDPRRLFYELDDAFFLEPSQPDPDIERLFDPEQGSIAVTASAYGLAGPSSDPDTLPRFARELEKIAAMTGARLIFVPHVNAAAGGAVIPDGHVGDRLVQLLKAPDVMSVSGIRLAREVRWLTGHAQMVISTRYHPLVFGLSAAVPGIGIYVDDYSRVKLQGALAHAHLDGWCLSLKVALDGSLTELAVELWHQRQGIRRYLESCRDRWRAANRQHWRRVLGALEVEDLREFFNYPF